MEKKLSKYELIQRLQDQFVTKNGSTIIGVENNSAVLQFKENQQILTASKQFLEHIDFDLSYFPLKHLGYKIITASISDILAMNGIASQIRIDIAASNRFSLDALEELMIGVKYCASKHNVDVVGLEINTSATGLTIATNTIGFVEPEQLVTRNGAKENDLICLTGDLGSAYTGMLLLEREKQIFLANPESQPNLEGYDYILERFLKPEPRLDILEILKKQNVIPTAMIILNNGLADGLMHIGKASQVGGTIHENKMPIDTHTFETLKSINLVGTTIALNGGEDYELLFTISQDDYEKIKGVSEISVIGYVTEPSAGYQLITNDNCQFEISSQGFEQQ